MVTATDYSLGEVSAKNRKTDSIPYFTFVAGMGIVLFPLPVAQPKPPGGSLANAQILSQALSSLEEDTILPP